MKNNYEKYFESAKKTTIFATRFKIIFFIWAAHEMFLNKKRFLQKVNDSVAQLVEHYTFNVGVLGSNPSGITNDLSKSSKTAQVLILGRFFVS